MLKIFDFNKNPIGYIWKYKDLKRESELSTGDKTLSFTYLAKTHDIKEEYYIQDKTDEYVVKEVNLSSDGFPQIVAKLNLEELEGNPWEKFTVTDSTIEEAARFAITGTGWRVGECTVTKRRSAGILNADTLTVIDKLCTVFMCERVYDTKNKTISFYEKVGEDKGMYFMRGLNLKKISEKSDTYDYYTRIQPIGKDGLTIESVNDGKNYLENYQYSNKVKTYLWIDESYEDPQALKEDAEAKLADMSKPLKSYSADIVDLAKRKPEYSILSFGLGDMVTLIDNGTGIKDEQRIVKLTEYPQDPDKNTCELANTSLTFEELQQKLKEAADIINAVVTDDGQFTGEISIYDILQFEEGVYNSNAVTELRQDYVAIDGELVAVKATIGQIETNYIKAEEAELKYATIEQLNVTNQTVHTIEGDYADFKVVTANELASHAGIIDNLQGDLANYKTVVAGELVTAKGWMLEGSIGSAQISDLDVTKLNAGILDTAIINLAGTNGKLQIIDNTIQISDDNRVRVQAGKDASGDYTLSVWDSSGKLIWDALGATENTIQRKIIRDQMVADDANIQGYKLDIESVIPEINGATTKISGTVVQVGDKTLNVALSEQETTIAEQGEAISKQAAEIKANQDSVNLKVDNQTYLKDKTTMESSLSKATSDISILQNQIALKVEQTDIDKSLEDYSTTVQMEAAITAAKNEIHLSVSNAYAKQDDLNGVETRLSSAEQKLTKDGIIQTVGDYYALGSDLTDAEERITTAESTILQHSSEIALTVKKDGIISAINQTAETVKISASKINLDGYVTLTNLSTAGQTSINGDNIKTGTISADRIDVTGLFAKDITATGTIRGVNLVGATGSFSGSVTIGASGGQMTLKTNDNYPIFTIEPTSGYSGYVQFSRGYFHFTDEENYEIYGGSTGLTLSAMGASPMKINASSGINVDVNDTIWLTSTNSAANVVLEGFNYLTVNGKATVSGSLTANTVTSAGLNIMQYGKGMTCVTDFGNAAIVTLSNGSGLYLATNKTGVSGWASNILLADTNGVNLVPKTGGTFTGNVRCSAGLTVNGDLVETSNMILYHGKGLYGQADGGSNNWIAGVEKRSSGTSSAAVNCVRIGQNTLRTYVYTASSVYSNGAWNNFSDRRLKEEFTKLDKRYLDMFDNLNPTLFLWKDKRDTRKQAGYVAQEVLAAMNAAGISESENTIVNKTWEYYDIDNKEAGGMEIYSLEYEGIDTIAVYALQDTRITVKQHGEDIEDLKQKYLELANENILLKAQIEFLQQQIAA